MGSSGRKNREREDTGMGQDIKVNLRLQAMIEKVNRRVYDQ